MSKPIKQAALVLAAASLPVLTWAADIPLELYTVPATGPNEAYQRLLINVGIGNGAAKPYLFDTGSNSFNAAYNPSWFPLTGSTTVATGATYTYGSGDGYYLNIIDVPQISFYGFNGSSTPAYTATGTYQIGQVLDHLVQTGSGTPITKYNGTPYYADPAFAANVASNTPPLEGAIFGTFGAADYTSYDPIKAVTYGSVLGQATSSGYVVAANAAAAQTATACSPCAILGLTPALRAQFNVTVPWSTSGSSFPNSGSNGATQFSTPLNFTLSGGGNTPVTWTGNALLDAGTPNLNLHTSADVSAYTDASGKVAAGYTLTISTPTGFSIQLTTTGGEVFTSGSTSPVTTDNTTVGLAQGGSQGVDGENNTPGIALFLNASVLFDLANQSAGLTNAFVTDAAIQTPYQITANAGLLGLAGVISGAGGVTVGNGGAAVLSNANTYTGTTTIQSGGSLALAGPGSIAASSGVSVAAGGTLDISRTAAGATISALSGAGNVYLGAQTLTLSAANGAFAGVLQDGGQVSAATGGALTIAGGSQTLTGVNTYTGATTVNSGATLALAGSGSIAASSGVAANGVFDVSGTAGTTVQSLSGSGAVTLGTARLTLSAASGTFSGLLSGAGGMTVAAGTQTLAGSNGYTGVTTVASGAVLALAGAGSLSASPVSVAGLFDVSQATAPAAAGLTGAGQVRLGGATLTLTAASGSFTGSLANGGIGGGSGGGLAVAGGVQTLAGANTYTGPTAIGPGATLALASGGSIASSAGVVANGTLDLTAAKAPALQALGGAGAVRLGSQTLTLTAANSSFAGVLSGTGGLTVTGGTQGLAGVNTYTGVTTIGAGATLALVGGGSLGTAAISNAGTLDISAATGPVSVAALGGGGAVALGGGALAVANAAGTFSGSLADGGLAGGSGGRFSVLAGSQTLTGSSSYTGQTTIAPGASLFLTGGGSIARSAVSAGGLFDISGTAGTSITSLSGSGRVNLGAQTLSISNGAGSFAGTIAGSGGLLVTGGTQALTGINSYSGGTTVNGGTLAVNSDAALGAVSGTLTLSNGGALVALGNVTGNRTVSVGAGGGTLNANGYVINLSNITTAGDLLQFGQVQSSGAVTHTQGTLSVNGSLNAAGLTVTENATLRGTGVISAPTTVRGTLAPGNSPGTLSFNAPVALSPNSTTRIDIDGPGTGSGAGNYSRLLVNGPLTLSPGDTLRPLLRGINGSASNSYVPPLGQTFTIVQAAGGIQGRYAALVQPDGRQSGTQFDTIYGPNTLTLAVTPAFYGNLAAAGVAETANQAAVGAALDATRPAAGQEPTALYSVLYGVGAAGIGSTLDQLAPLASAERVVVARDSWSMVQSAALAELEARRGALPNPAAQRAPGPLDGTVWVSGLGRFSSVSGQRTPGYSSQTGGTAAGVDVPVLPWLRTGFSVGYTGDAGHDSARQRFDGDALHLQAYGSLSSGAAFLDVQGGGAFWEGNTYRAVGAYGVTTRANASGTTAGGTVRGGVHLQLGEWMVEPSLGFGAARLRQDGFAETQGGAAALSVGATGLVSVQSVIGARVERAIGLGGAMRLLPSARIGWVHEYADQNARSSASFLATGGPGFTVQTAPTGRNAALLGLAATLETGTPISVFAAYDSALNGYGTSQTLRGGFRVTW